jgi:hypothetical protein
MTELHALAARAYGEAVPSTCVMRMRLARTVGKDHALMRRLRTFTYCTTTIVR